MRLAVFMDGTWNDPADDTNVNKICGRVPETQRGPDGGGQRKRYIPGVGNRSGFRLRGGAFGYGVDDNIRDGYRFIAENHLEGDDIFLFGFSRGAFTARSLAGMITKCGILSPRTLDADVLLGRYRDRARPGLREMREREKDPRTDEDRTVLEHARLVRIRFIGVFDTVGSLGVPGDLGQMLTRSKYQFHDTNLSGFVDTARHAVAIDERRPEFKPTLWTAVPIPIPGHQTSIEQRWFIGAHSDVGGSGATLAAIAREWIVDEARKARLEIGPPTSGLTGAEWRSGPSDSYGSWLRHVAWLVPGRRPYLRPVNTAERETLDPSILLRWDHDPTYRPSNPNLEPWVKRGLRGLTSTASDVHEGGV
jgi:uncharacterized protein (DUF2235 family)